MESSSIALYSSINFILSIGYFFSYISLGGNMRLSDLQNKDIVNVNDGKNIGSIIDVKIDETTMEIKKKQ